MSTANRRGGDNALRGVGALLTVAVGDKATHAVRGVWSTHATTSQKVGRLYAALGGEFRHWWHVSLHGVDLLGGLGLLLLCLMVIAYQRAGRQTERIGEEHGSARWAKPNEMRPFAPRKGEGGIAFTATETLALDTRRTRRNLNALVIGSAGSRKTRSFVMPNVLSGAGASIALTDPKGEIRRAVQSRLEAMGYNVRILNLVDLGDSWGFNPFAYVNPEQPEVSIATLADTIVSNTEGNNRRSSDDFWDRAEKALLTALMAYAYFTGGGLSDDSDVDAMPSLVTVADLAKKLEASERDEAYRSEVDQRMNEARMLLDTWEDLPDMTKAESDHVRDGLRFATSQYRIFEQAAGETKKGVIISLGVRLQIIDVPAVRRILSHDTLELDRMGHEKTCIFAILPDTNTAFRFVSALFWQSVFSTNIYIADHSASGSLPLPVLCYLDEFANIGVIPDFPTLIATIRSRGISAAIIVQALAQLRARYKDDWETIIGNCDSVLFLGGTEPTTLDWLSKRLGNETFKAEQTSMSYGSNGNWSRSLHATKRELMTPDELAHLSDDECIYLLRGVYPFRSRKAKIYVG